MTRAHPYVLEGTRLIVPLYSDGFSFSLMAISDDWGATWKQWGQYHYPSIIQAADGTLHATYSFFAPPAAAKQDGENRLRKAIKHAHFSESWIRSGGAPDASRPTPVERE